MILTEEYSSILTKKKKQKHFLLKTVQVYRKEYTEVTKRVLSGKL